MWMNLVWGLPYLVAVVAGALVCAVAGPKGPGTGRWRVPGVVGFGLLTLQHLLQTGQTLMLYTGSSPTAYFGSPAYVALSAIGTVCSLVGLVLIASAVVRGRGPVGIFTAGGWGAPTPGPSTGPAEPGKTL